jgi:type II secretory pathway predicted ATPase ExeA
VPSGNPFASSNKSAKTTKKETRRWQSKQKNKRGRPDMAPELINSIDARELRDIAAKVRYYQSQKKLSDENLVKKYPSLGSTKTYKRILADDLKELDLERQLNNYRTVWALIESIGYDDEETEELYDDLYCVIQLKRAVFEIMRENGNARLVLLQADSGLGKTSARKLLCEKYGQRILWVEATAAWRDGPMALMSSILRALGIKEIPSSGIDRLNAVLDRLTESRVCLMVEEAHHMGPQCLNVIKTLINQSPGEFVLLAMPTLWNRLTQKAYEEVRQLTGNRLAERIKLDGLRESDVDKLLKKRLTLAPDATRASAKLFMERAPRYGNLAFVRDVIDRAKEKAEGEPVTLDLLSTCVAEEIASR